MEGLLSLGIMRVGGGLTLQASDMSIWVRPIREEHSQTTVIGVGRQGVVIWHKTGQLTPVLRFCLVSSRSCILLSRWWKSLNSKLGAAGGHFATTGETLCKDEATQTEAVLKEEKSWSQWQLLEDVQPCLNLDLSPSSSFTYASIIYFSIFLIYFSLTLSRYNWQLKL